MQTDWFLQPTSAALERGSSKSCVVNPITLYAHTIIVWLVPNSITSQYTFGCPLPRGVMYTGGSIADPVILPLLIRNRHSFSFAAAFGPKTRHSTGSDRKAQGRGRPRTFSSSQCVYTADFVGFDCLPRRPFDLNETPCREDRTKNRDISD